MIKNRFLSITVITLIYIFAAVCGLISYNFFTNPEGLNLSYGLAIFLADVFATIVIFVFSLIFNNASVYDPYWSVQPPVILAAVLIKNGQSENPLMAFLLFAAVLFWAIRLTGNWIYNFESFDYQDWRYVMLREKSGKLYPFVNFLGIHLFPTVVVFLCILPAVIAVVEGGVFSPACLIFIILSFVAALIQLIADLQMQSFRKSGSGGFIRKGLWKHARHPNYAGEILMWWGIGLASVISLGGKWQLLCGALINTLMFLFVSIPMADKRQSRKPGFEEYKKETRMLI
ncbi:MAG: DUF1295 domain-containing protein [Treponema sp.]|nr:DUF1295 domain-containing protein [Treponema sp.]